MLLTLVTAALAVAGTLLGSIVSGRFQERAAERSVRLNQGEAVRRERMEAVTALACAVSDHRHAMWKRGDAVLNNTPAERVEALRGESHLTRSAVTRPLTALRVLIEDRAVRAAADEMVMLTYTMRQSYTSAEDLSAAREASKAAEDTFVDAAARYLQAA